MATPDLRALVTGASAGIGAAFARALRARGEKLVLVARRAERLEALARELGGSEAVAVVALDLARPGAVAELAKTLDGRGVVVDTLVNNAGVGHTGRFAEEPEDRILAMLDLNVRAAVLMTRRFLPGMLARKRGSVINVVSTSAFQPVPYMSTYAASKSFLLSFTEGVAFEVRGSGVNVQALCPGLTATEFQQVAGTDQVPFNKTATQTPEAVVKESLAGLDRGRERVVSGWLNRATLAAQAFVPQSVSKLVAAKMFEPKA
jgi:short-subunit dehydrogenase